MNCYCLRNKMLIFYLFILLLQCIFLETVCNHLDKSADESLFTKTNIRRGLKTLHHFLSTLKNYIIRIRLRQSRTQIRFIESSLIYGRLHTRTLGIQYKKYFQLKQGSQTKSEFFVFCVFTHYAYYCRIPYHTCCMVLLSVFFIPI